MANNRKFLEYLLPVIVFVLIIALFAVYINLKISCTLGCFFANFPGKAFLYFLTAFLVASSLSVLLFSYLHKNRTIDLLQDAGEGVAKLLSWLFSVNGLFLLLVGSILALVVFILENQELFKSDEVNSLQLITVVLTLVCSTLIPTMISRIIAKSQLDEIIEGKMENEFEKYRSTLFSIRRDKGHASRMSAVLLEQLAASKDANNDPDLGAKENAAWAVGWASDAIIQYLLIKDNYDNALKNSADCFLVISKAISHLVSSDSLLSGKIKFNDFKTLLTMHSLLQYYN